ncbi:MAG TPA: glycosyltransferase [Kofleriaceae bacterium]|jgi:glycosyltransferase involved in cell wall biosynthesis|nr:glycosyltransferase [Kofleriaceae bacterium]
MPPADGPRISVMMPVLDPHSVYFPCAVASVLAQTEVDLELIIVEDPSATRADRVARLDDPRIRYIRNETRTSLVDQRNRALAEARADIVAMLDADDIAEPDRFAKQLAFLDAHPAIGLVGSQLTIIDADGDVIGSRSYPLEHDDIVAAMCRYNAIAQPAVMARRRVLVDAGGYQYRTFPVNEDYELWSRLVQHGVRVANHPEVLLRYRVHPFGTKAAMLRRMLRATLDVKNQFWRDKMDVRARLRFWGEHVLVGLPPSWVLKLFVAIQYDGRT